MLPVELGTAARPLRTLLVIGAHPDDIEIGCGGTLLRILAEQQPESVTWFVLTGDQSRAAEAKASAETFLEETPHSTILLGGFRDGFLPWCGPGVKEAFEELKETINPDLVLTHCRSDAHQDHQLVAELTWNTFRDHLILEYEIPKYEGDLGAPNLFVPLEEHTAARKVDLILKGFPSQHTRHWFDSETFWSVLRLRGLESNSPTRFAEGFSVRKMVW